MKRVLKYAAMGGTVLLLAVLVFKVVDVASAQRESAQSQAARDKIVTDNQRALAAANAKVAALAQQLEALGKDPVVSPKPVVVSGQRGPGPTTGQLLVALAEYCQARGGCRGPQGPPGMIGSQGSPGANGADGAQGPPGPAGADGRDGADGRGIESVMCGADGRWTVTYTDGTSSDAGACLPPVIAP